MPASTSSPTPYSDANAILNQLLSNVQTILGQRFVGMYLEGSLANGDFDAASDIDFIVVTDEEATDDLFSALQVMHEQMQDVDSPWAIQLEGSYISRHALRRYDPHLSLHPNIERGPGERLKWAHHDAAWITHRWIMRERGITLAGPPPQTLIDPISPADLQQAMVAMLPAWTESLLQDPAPLQARGYQSFTVLSLCRVLYTLRYGAVASKLTAARWAQETLDERWRPLIERALAGRHDPDSEPSHEDLIGTLEFIRYTQSCSDQCARRIGHISHDSSI